MKDKQLATSVDTQADMRTGDSLFYVVAMPRPGVKVADLENALEEEIAAVKKDGVTDAEMEKARAQFRRQQIQARQSDLYTAMRIGEYAVKFNDPDLINTIFDKFNAVTAEQVKTVANKYLISRQQAVVIDLPAKKETTAASR